jgi:integrase
VAIDGVEQTFALLRERAGVPSRGGRRPTVHGLRHTFAIRTMLDAYRDGVDAGARLGVLSTYLGHYAGDRVKRAQREPALVDVLGRPAGAGIPVRRLVGVA